MSDAANLASGLLSRVTGALVGVPVTLAGAGSGTAAAPAGTEAQKAKLAKIAHQFEAIFTRQMLAQAHKASFGEAPSDAMSTFTNMQDAQFADIAASHDTLGIAKMLEKTLGARATTGATTGPTTATGGH